MTRVTLKQLVEKYNAPDSILKNWYFKRFDANISVRTAIEDNIVSEIEHWLGYLVYTKLIKYAQPRHFIVERVNTNRVRLIFSYYGKEYELCSFSFSTSRRNVYVRKNFRPLLCLLTRIEKQIANGANFPDVVKECCRE